MDSIVTTADDNRSIILSHIMTPDMANFSGNIHGGHILHLLDQAAFACSVNYCSTKVATLSVDHVLFKQPIHVGEHVTFYANVNFVGNSSMEIGIKVVAKDLQKKIERHVMTCYFTMISLSDDMKPSKVAPLPMRNDVDRRRARQAKLRRQMSLDFREKHRQLKDGELPLDDC